MSHVLFVKANDRPAEQSVTIQMYEAFLQTYKEAHADDTISELDLFQVELPYYGDKAISGLYKLNNGIKPSMDEKAAADLANRYVDQFLEADKIVIAFPMWNFTIPGPLLTYISYLMQADKTFKETPDGPVGLAKDKKVAILTARGGIYSQEQMAPLEMSLHYVKVVIGLWGIHQPDTVVIEGHNQFPERSQNIISAGLKQTVELASHF